MTMETNPLQSLLLRWTSAQREAESRLTDTDIALLLAWWSYTAPSYYVELLTAS